LNENALGYTLGDFFSQTHLVTLLPVADLAFGGNGRQPFFFGFLFCSAIRVGLVELRPPINF
jgi:hypothetical protein